MNPPACARTWTLIGADGRPYESEVPGTLGGHRRTRIYGLLDCPAAARAIARGGYVTSRVFFLDESTAVAAGYRPCAVCMKDEYLAWRQAAAEGQALEYEGTIYIPDGADDVLLGLPQRHRSRRQRRPWPEDDAESRPSGWSISK